MTNFSTLLQQGNAWLFVPSAILLGALHGLEPGHSKTMMAAFIVAIRGTMAQAVLLGLSATVSHTAVVWAVAMAGLYFGRNWDAEASEPYFQLASGAIIIAVAAWMLWRAWRNQQDEKAHQHEHHHPHEEKVHVDTGAGILSLEIFEQDVPPRFRVSNLGPMGRAWTADDMEVETVRPNGARQVFTFVQREGFVESMQEIPEPHEFLARLSISRDARSDVFEAAFVEHHHQGERADLSSSSYQDEHERAHASDIQRRFAGRQITMWQIVIFGLTGGLIPCPASITVLLLCLQLKKVALGATLVLCFSIGLALTMVASGALAALSVKHVSRRWSGFGTFARKAPYLSGFVIVLVGLFVCYQGLSALSA